MILTDLRRSIQPYHDIARTGPLVGGLGATSGNVQFVDYPS